MTIAGPYELMRPRTKNLSSQRRDTLQRVFAALDFDFGVLAPEEERLFARDSSLSDWLAAGDEPETAVMTVMDRTVGVIALPRFEGRQDWDSFIQALRPTLQAMRLKSDLLIGISSWGWNLESHFLTGPDSGLDLLLGSGPGPAFRGKYMAHNKTLWIRPYSRGRAVNTITIPNFQDTAWLVSGWKPNVTIRTGLAILRGSMPQDPTVSAIIKGQSSP